MSLTVSPVFTEPLASPTQQVVDNYHDNGKVEVQARIFLLVDLRTLLL